MGGTPGWFIPVVLGAALLAVGVIVFLVIRMGGEREAPCPACGRMMLASWTACMFCKAPRGGAGAPYGGAGTPHGGAGAPYGGAVAPRGGVSPARPGELEFVSGPLKGTVLALDRDVSTIGSAPGNTVLLGDTGVSRKHAGIRRVDGAYELADLGSTNGVYVNGQKVVRHRLTVGDIIRVGATEMVFRS